MDMEMMVMLSVVPIIAPVPGLPAVITAPVAGPSLPPPGLALSLPSLHRPAIPPLHQPDLQIFYGQDAP